MSFLENYKPYLKPLLKIVLLWVFIGVLAAVGITVGVDKKIVGIFVAVFGFLTNAFSGLLTMVALVPFIGPLIVKVVSLPLFWVLNGIGYILSAFAVKQGYAKEVLNYRVLTVVFLLGIVVGFVLGSVLG